jgi:hypothetical protein
VSAPTLPPPRRGILWAAAPNSRAHAYWSPSATLSICGHFRLDAPVGDLPDAGPGPHRERHPERPCAHCLAALALRQRPRAAA